MERHKAKDTASNHLYYGDNLRVLRDSIADQSVDLVYLDPPFNSNGNYNVLFRSPSGERSHAQIEAFGDTWHWTDEAERAFDDVMRCGNCEAAEVLRALRAFLKENDMMAYLAMMCVRLIKLRRILKETGASICIAIRRPVTIQKSFSMRFSARAFIGTRSSGSAQALTMTPRGTHPIR